MTDAIDEARHFAVRRVNPFEGVLQVVETDDARAYSRDGSVWQIQVLSERPDHTWRCPADHPPRRQFFGFGQWHADAGMQRVPANPILDIGAMCAAADVLIAALQQLSDALPFRLVDDHECWAIDAQGLPVALLATSDDASRLGDVAVGDWRAVRAVGHGRVGPAPGGAHAESDDAHWYPVELEYQVRERAPDRAWWRRTAGGAGQRLTDRDDRLDAAAFPPLGLATDWPDGRTRTLVDDYVGRRAPELLLLQNIGDELRRSLEPRACRRAAALAAVYRLIPHVIDSAAIEAARVEAMLRNAAT